MIFRFWRIPRITEKDKQRLADAECTLRRLQETNARADGVSYRNRIVRQNNHFSQAIFGGPRE